MSLVARVSRSRARFAFWTVAAVTLLVSHDAVYLAQTGPGEALARALREGGHAYWGLATVALVALGAVVGAGVAIRLHRLRQRAGTLGVARGPMRPRAYFARSLRCWVALFAVVAAGFAIQENVEHLVAHGHLIWTGALIGDEYPLAMPVLAAISLISGLVAGAIATVERDLLVRIAAAIRRVFSRAPRRLVRPPAILRLATIPVLARAGAGRAPPDLLAFPT